MKSTRPVLAPACVALVFVVIAGGCGEEASDRATAAGAEGGTDLVDHTDAEETPEARFDFQIEPSSLVQVTPGPFAGAEGAAIVDCGPGGVLAEGRSLEIRTGACDPADVATTLPAAVPAGTVFEATLSHAALVADGGEAHFAVVVGDEVVWEQRTNLPAPAAFLAPRATLARAHAAGERVVVHVHNHGTNVYSVHGLRLSSP